MSILSFDHKSIIAGVLLFVVMAGLILAPLTIRAVVTTESPSEIAKLVTLIGNAVKQLAELIFQSGQLSSLNTYFIVWKPAVKFLSSLILKALTESIIRWIQDGGNTNFVSNLQGALVRAADEAAGEFLNYFAGINLCGPIANPLRGILRIPRLSLDSRLSCTATGIFANLQTTYQEFLNDFTSGGWIAYESTFYGSNNYIDGLINSIDAKLEAESRRTAIVQARFDAGQGFLGITVKKQDCRNALPDNTYNDGSLICETVDVQTTPGRLVADTLSKAVGSGIDQAVNINDIGQALDAIIGALIYKLVTSAQAGLFSNNEQSGLFDRDLLLIPSPEETPPIPSPQGTPPMPTPQGTPPDLYISTSPTPIQTNILAGDLIEFSGTIKNQGGTAINTPFNARFKIDVDDDGTFDETINANSLIFNVPAGGEVKVTSVSWRASNGTHRVILCAEALPAEALQENNCSLGGTGIFAVGQKPDLTISENPSIYSGIPNPGQLIIFKGEIKNQGGAAATATSTFENRFQIDLNNDGTTDITLSPNPTIASLAAGATQTIISPSWSAILGTHRVILCADIPSRVITESDELNNCNPAGTGLFTIGPFISP